MGIAHSWSGNLVTNSEDKHFWLNEGLTTFIEGKIVGRIHGEAVRDIRGILWWHKLERDVNIYNTTSLVGLTLNEGTLSYGKGMAFARFLEDTVGGAPIFEKFLKAYFVNFAVKSIGTEDFKSFFLQYFSNNPAVSGIDWNTWLHKPGMPVVKPNFDTSLVDECRELAKLWQEKDVGDMDHQLLQSLFNKMIPVQQFEFFEILLQGQALGVQKIELMSRIYKLDKSPNAEILMRWWRLGIKSRYIPSANQALENVTKYGRIRIIKPVYTDLWGWKKMRQKTLRKFGKHRQWLMKDAVKSISSQLSSYK